MSFYNPDSPTTNTMGFIQHTYQAPTNNSFYWNGIGPNIPNMNDGSRRAINPVNPTMAPNPFNQFGQVPTTNIIDNGIQPYGAYPPSRQDVNYNGNSSFMPTCGTGLNSMVESRRNAPQNNVLNSNPWAAQNNPVPMMNQNTAWPSSDNMNPYGYDPMFCNRVDMNSAALYNNNNTFGFEKKSAWDNCYTQNRQISYPNIDWNSMNPNVPNNMNNNYGYGIPNQFNTMNQFKTSSQSWKDIAEQNWATTNL